MAIICVLEIVVDTVLAICIRGIKGNLLLSC
jgi:hypothetical protein